ncbi:MAG: hypothetical protein AB7U82_27430 [Blastocatellales bacterium]
MQYISVEHQRAISPRYKTALMVVFVFCVSVILFAVVGRFADPEAAPGSERLIKIFPVVVIVLAFGVIVLRRVWMSVLVMAGAARTGVNAVLNRLVQMSVVCAALSEIVAILGFVFYMLTGNYRYLLILCLVSLMLLFYTAFPRRGEWDRAVAAAANTQTK